MRNSLLLGLGLLVALVAGVSLSSPAEAGRYRCAQCGTVEDVDRIWYDGRRDDRRDSGTEGAVIGAIIGGALGNQIGGGSGRTAATVAGVVVGGLVGRDIDRNDGRGNNRNNRGERGMRLVVRMDRGGYQTVEIHGEMRIYRGDRVRLRDGRVDLI